MSTVMKGTSKKGLGDYDFLLMFSKTLLMILMRAKREYL